MTVSEQLQQTRGKATGFRTPPAFPRAQPLPLPVTSPPDTPPAPLPQGYALVLPTSLHAHVLIAQSPWLTLGFAPGLAHRVGLGRCGTPRPVRCGVTRGHLSAPTPSGPPGGGQETPGCPWWCFRELQGQPPPWGRVEGLAGWRGQENVLLIFPLLSPQNASTFDDVAQVAPAYQKTVPVEAGKSWLAPEPRCSRRGHCVGWECWRAPLSCSRWGRGPAVPPWKACMSCSLSPRSATGGVCV